MENLLTLALRKGELSSKMLVAEQEKGAYVQLVSQTAEAKALKDYGVSLLEDKNNVL